MNIYKEFQKKTNPAYRSIDTSWVDQLIALDIAADRLYGYTLSTYMLDNKLHKIPDKLDSEIQNKIKRLHDAGFIHCDLHEANIVFDIIDNGQCDDVDYDVRLIDFETLRSISELKDDKDSNEHVQLLCNFVGCKNYNYDSTLEGLIKFERYCNYKQCETL